MEKVIVTGDSKQIDLLIRESKVKISRGLLTFEKVNPKAAPKANGKDNKPPKTETPE
jgi:hypothetical protein